MKEQASRSSCWGTFSLVPGEVRRWRVGPLTLWLQRLEGEWRVAWEPPDAPDAAAVEAAALVDDAGGADLLEREHAKRFAVAGAGGQITLSPALADRPVVARPEKPFHLPAGAEAVVYVSSPLWVVLTTGDVELMEIPLARPSDTWLGPSTMEGELCYASRTFLRLALDNVVERPHRAITRVHIINRAETELPLRALKLPAPHLALYRAGGGQIWTQDITFVRNLDDTLAALRLRDRPPVEAPDSEPLGEPRAKTSDAPMVRAFSALLSSLGGGQ